MKKSSKIAIAAVSGLFLVAVVILGISLWKDYGRVTDVIGDTSWYREDEKEFTISTMEQLYGLAELSESHDFKGQTIKLGADIVVNEGNAEDWEKKAPEHRWITITGFAGRFDGEGHTISGVYGDSIITSLGLFTDTQKTSVIRDFKLVNSLFKNNNEKGTGSIIGFGGGKLEDVYSDATIISAGRYVGGLIGRMNTKGENQITNCWFDGTITMKGNDSSEVGGIVGAVTVEDAINAISHCLSTAEITCKGVNVGGICGSLGSNSFVNLIDSMYTGVLNYSTDLYDKVGSAIGQVPGGTSAIIKDTYTIDEIANRTIGTTKGYQEGSAIAVSAEDLIGIGGYQWTTLDFEKYWSVQKDDTPILTYFAENSESIAGVERLVDISWYSPTGMTFEIKNMQQFYGFAYLSRSYDFSGQTIKLGADITVNEGNAEDWQKEAPKNKWTPIAWHGTSLSKRFKGNFDGQGHTISGIYCVGDEDDGYIGLFGEIYHGSVVKNFRIENSYFEGKLPSSARGTVGSVCGRLRGTIDSVYSNAIIVNSAKMTGGMAGMINGTGQNTISNCWFDGKITGVSRTGGILGGVYGNKASIEATIENCLNTGEIAVQLGKGDVGGICGIAETWCTLYINDCLNAGTFKTVGEGAKANTHIGTIFGSVTKTNDVGSKVVIKNSFGTKDFYARLVGWKFGDEGILQNSTAFVDREEIVGYGGYQWTTLDFKDGWAVRTNDVPVPAPFATSRPSVSGVARMVDYSWYDAGKDTFTIKNYQQLYAAARLWDVTNQFKGKTIKLGADIVVNEGNATDWAKEAPALVWEPMRFNGTFDGAGHSISGIYVKGGEEDNYVGLFYRIYKDGSVKNLKLVNSYIEGTMPSNKRGAVGSIAGRSNGIIDTVYSDAIVVNSARMTGGIVGMMTGEGKNKISNAWFDGSLTGTGRMGGIIGGVYGNKEDIEVTLEHCLNTGDIEVQIGYGDVGGLCGIAETGGTLNITDSLNAGTFRTVGEGKDANTHIGTLVGSVTETKDASSKVVAKHVYGVKEFYSKLVGWSYDAKAVTKTSTGLTELAKVIGDGGYQWTSLDFDKFWTVRSEDVPMLLAFSDKKADLSGVAKILDDTWYNEDSKELIINNVQQLYTFAALCNNNSSDFEGKTIKLGADIVVNEGNAADWAKNAPKNVWEPVKFNGTFDGQGHTISGIYVKGGAEDNYVGLFARVYKDGVVKNLKLENSYIEGTMASNQRGAVGSIAGRSNGIIDTVYSDAIVVNSARMTGGIVGMITGEGTNKITNSWFDGTLSGVSRSGGILGGVYGNKENINVTIEHCLNTGDLSVPFGIGDVGAICGMVETGGTLNIEDSLGAGSFTVVGEGDKSKENNHVGTMIGSLGDPGNTETKVVIQNSYGVEEFFNRLVGWTYDKKAVSQKAVVLTDMETIEGNGGYQWTTLNFGKYWVARTEDTPVLASFAESKPELVGSCMVDFSWYDENEAEYTIKTKEQLYAFALLCDSIHDYFAGKTVNLGADIALNDVDGDTDGAKIATVLAWGETAPANVWAPLNFQGTFNGNGHTLSGVYVKSDATYVGFFTNLQSGAAVKNLDFKYSYIENTNTEGRCGTGGIAGRLRGTIENVYSNAIVKNGALMTGGIAGMTDTTSIEENKIANCWFDGEIYANGSTGGILGGSYKASANIANCLNTGTLNVNVGSSAVGGLCGYAQSASSLILTNSLNAGAFTKVGEGDVKQLGTVLGALHADAKLDADHVYGAEEFSAKKFGYTAAKPKTDLNKVLVRKADDLTGHGAYQWTTLEFEDADADKVYWVLRKDNVPTLNVFAEAELKVADAKKLPDFRWYDPEETEIVLDTTEELLAFNVLGSTYGEDYEGKTVKLGADITLNEVAGDTDAAKKATVTSWSDAAPSNVWIPIEFKGTFDGNGKTLSGVYAVSEGQTGLFSIVGNGAIVKDLTVEYSYFECTREYDKDLGADIDNYYGTGTIAGELNSGTIERVKSSAIVKNGSMMTGGIAGLVNNATSTISNCWFAGEIYSIARTGGILGGAYNGATATIEHCLNTGIVSVSKDTSGTNKHVGGLAGYAEKNSKLIVNDSLNVGTFAGALASITQVGTAIGAHNGTSSFEINNVYGINTFVGTGRTPALFGYASASVKEQCASSQMRTAEQLTGTAVYQWTTLDFEDDAQTEENDKYWVLVEGQYPELAVFSDATDTELLAIAKALPDYTWYTEDAVSYTISTARQLYGFNALNKDYDGKTITLGADIALNEVSDEEFESWKTETPSGINPWIPRNFKGTFDGNGKTISGIYVKGKNTDKLVGLFARVYAAGTVRNLNLEKCYFEGNYTGTDAKHGVGSIAGRINGLIQNVHSSAVVKNSGTMTGGLVGLITEYSTATPNKISNCWFDGKIIGSDGTGGILGGVYKTGSSTIATIEHCLSTSPITVATDVGNVGGICGIVDLGATLNVNDSLNTGSLTMTGNGNASSAIGNLVGTVTDVNGVTSQLVMNDSYGINGFSTKLVGSATEDNVTRTSSAVRTAEQLKGTAAYQWTTLDFEDDSQTTENDKYWVLVNNAYPTLRAFDNSDDSTLLANAKTLNNYSWYAEDVSTYTISTKQELLGFNELCEETYQSDMFNVEYAINYFDDATVNLGNDIDLNDVSWNEVVVWRANGIPTDVTMWINKEFKGTFNGCGNTLSGICVNSGTHTGFFKKLHSGATVKDLKLINSYFKCKASSGDSRTGVGSIAGQSAGTIEKVFVNVIVESQRIYTGGIVGMAVSGGNTEISNCWFNGHIYARGSSAGILGGSYAASATINHCLNTGIMNITTISDKANTQKAIGGLCGHGQSTASVYIYDSINAGTVSITGTASQIGSTIGTVGNDASLTVGNVYGILGNYDDLIGYQKDNVTVESTMPDHREYVSEDDNNKLLNLNTTYWNARENTYPMLADFKTLAETLGK